MIINFLNSKNKVGFKAYSSIPFFHVEVTFDDVCNMLKHKIKHSAWRIATIV